MGSPITVSGYGLTVTMNTNGTVVLSPQSAGVSTTFTSPTSSIFLPGVSTTTLEKILAVVEAALPAVSTVLPSAGPIGALVAMGIQVVENLFGRKTGAQKLTTLSKAVTTAVEEQHSTVPNAPPLPVGYQDAITAMVQKAVDVYKAEGAL